MASGSSGDLTEIGCEDVLDQVFEGVVRWLWMIRVLFLTGPNWVVDAPYTTEYLSNTEYEAFSMIMSLV